MAFTDSRNVLITVVLGFVILVVGCGETKEAEPEFTDDLADDYSQAVVDISGAAQADALLDLKELDGGVASQKLYNDAAYPFEAVDTILEILEDRVGCAQATVPDRATLDGDRTVEEELADLANEIADSWPEESEEIDAIDRTRESLPEC
jgi:hypothetical protein